MKSIHKLIIASLFGIFCTLSINASAQTAEELFIKANNLYNESSYDSAVATYKTVINKGYSSATLYYNMGNAYYKLRNYPMAILYYEKSLKLDPNNEDTKHNIEIAKAFISDKIENVPEIFIKTWWNKLSNSLSIKSWSIIALCLLFTLLLTTFLFLTTKTRIIKKSTFFVSIILLAVTICCFSITTKKYRYINSNKEGIVISPTITIKSSPSSTSVDLFVLHEGAKVKILDSTDEWEKIKIANGSVGWLPSTAVVRY